jgi:hypothetical protein
MESESLLQFSQIPPVDHVLSRMDPVLILTPYFFNIPCNSILSSAPKPHKWYFPFRFSD